MALDLQDQEELENAKHAWRLWGRWVFLALLLAAAAYVGSQLWQNYERRQNAEAGDYFEREFIAHAENNDEAGVLTALQTLQRDYPKTAPTALATLTAADASFAQGKYDQAAGHLRWLIDNQKNSVIRVLARQRLATVYLQEKKYDEALNVLDAKVPQAFAAHVHELRGDILRARGKNDEARAAYEEALKTLAEGDPSRDLIEIKSRW